MAKRPSSRDRAEAIRPSHTLPAKLSQALEREDAHALATVELELMAFTDGIRKRDGGCVEASRARSAARRAIRLAQALDLPHTRDDERAQFIAAADRIYGAAFDAKSEAKRRDWLLKYVKDAAQALAAGGDRLRAVVHVLSGFARKDPGRAALLIENVPLLVRLLETTAIPAKGGRSKKSPAKAVSDELLRAVGYPVVSEEAQRKSRSRRARKTP